MKEEGYKEYEPRYSGPNRTGICVCGHGWEAHHLGMVMRKEYIEQTGEGYIAQECCFFGCNEYGGMMPTEDGPWVSHCYSYQDSGEEIGRCDSVSRERNLESGSATSK